MLIRSATIGRRREKRNQSIALAILYFGAITFWLAGCLTIVAQEAQPAAVGGEPRPADVDPPEPTAMEIAKEFQLPPEPRDDATKNELKAYRAELRVVRDRIRTAERAIRAAAGGNGNLASVEGGFENFMQGYVFPRMTQIDRETLSTLGEIRDDFIGDYLSDNVLGGARQQVIAVTVPAMKKILENADGKNYHEAVRLNAILMLGMIDARPASRNNNSLPIPSPQVFEYLVDVYTGNKFPPYLKIGALAGIQRQVEIDHMRGQPQLPKRDQIAQEALRIVQAPANTDADYWLKRRSLQVLGYLGEVGPNGVVLDEISKIALDDKQKKWLRFDAISALGNLKYDATVGDQAKAIPVTVARYTAEMLKSESAAIKHKLDDLITKNLLFEDLDLQEKGNADVAKSGRSDRGGGIGAGGGSLAGGDEPPPGGVGGGGSRGGKNDLGPRVELANYHLNDARLKVKVIAFTAKKVISTPSLADFVEESFVNDFITELDSLIVDADVGIKNLDDEEEEIDPTDEEALAIAKKANTMKMVELFADYANRIGGMIPQQPIAAPAEPTAPAEPAKPAEDPLSKGDN